MNLIFRKTAFFLFLTYAISPIFAQKKEEAIRHKIDSLFSEIVVKPNTKEKVEKLISLYLKGAKKHYTSYPIMDEAILVSKDIFYNDGIAKAYMYMGISKRHEQDYFKSVENHKKALTYFQETTDTLAKIKCLNSLGTTYRKINLGKEAFQVYFKAFELANKMENTRAKAVSLNGIGNVFVDIQKYKVSLYYFKKALKYEQQNKNNRGIEYDLTNIAEAHLYLKNYDSTKIYIDKALKYASKKRRKYKIGAEYNLLGLLNQKQKKYKESILYYQKAIDIFEKDNNYRYLSNALINTGTNYLHLNLKEKGKNYIKKGIEYAEKVGSKENILLGKNALINYHIINNNYKRAFETQKAVTFLKDSILNDAYQKNITSFQVAYKTLEKEDKISRLLIEKKREKLNAKRNFKRLIYSIVLAILMLTSVLISFFLYRKNTDLKFRNMEKELQSYVLQLNRFKNNTLSKSLREKAIKFDLSGREVDVLRLISEGKTNTEISESLNISINTVKSHIKSIYVKLDVSNRVQVLKKINEDKR